MKRLPYLLLLLALAAEPNDKGLAPPAKDLPPLKYVDAPAPIPFYLPSAKWGTQAEPLKKMQAPLSPEDSLKHIRLPEGFHAELFAAEPDIVKVVAMAWDPRGRLWVAETVDYPNDMQPPGQGHDRVKICEDTDHDGRADKFTIFADHLSIPTSLCFANGGLIVAQAPDMLSFKDTDGDDRADVRKVLFTGFGTRDTHAGPSNLRYGFDNWIWGTVGYSGFDGTVGAKPIRFSQGIFRFKPDGSAIEFLTSTSNNTWGLGFSETGEVFASTANNQHSVFLAIPNRYYESVRGWHGLGSACIADSETIHPITEFHRQMDWHGRFTAAAGHALYTARAFPREYWNRIAFVTEGTGHLVHQNILEAQGSGYVARDGFNFLASTDEWTAPVVADVGPDGAVWVSDWYSYIFQHNPTPQGFQTGKGNAYVTPLRDKTHGRVYRVVYDGNSKPHPLKSLDGATPEQLVASLSDDNLFWRLIAQRLLVERGDRSVMPKLSELVNDTKLDAIGNAPAALHALWTMQGLGDCSHVLDSLKHPASSVRKAACEILFGEDLATTNAFLASGVLKDPDPHVRLSALLALTRLAPSESAGNALVEAINATENAQDRWISDAFTAAAARNSDAFLRAALARPVAKPQAAAVVEKMIRVVATHYAQGKPLESVIATLSQLRGVDDGTATALLEGLSSGWPADATLKPDRAADETLLAVSASLSKDNRARLAMLAARFGRGELFAEETAAAKRELLSQLNNDSLDPAVRLDSARRILNLADDASSVEAILKLAKSKTTPAFSTGLISTLAESRQDTTASVILKNWPALSPAARKAAIDVLLRRAAWHAAVLDAMQAGTISRPDLSAEQAQQLVAVAPDQRAAKRARSLLSAFGRLPTADRQKVIDKLLPLADHPGDASAGKVIFDKNCAVCHTFGGAGGRVGPDLTGIGKNPRREILLNILDPNRSVEGNYRLWIVQTKDGQTISGRLDTENQTSVELLDATGKPQIVQRKDIKRIVAQETSIMPEGFELLPENELTNLVEFLTQGGLGH